MISRRCFISGLLLPTVFAVSFPSGESRDNAFDCLRIPHYWNTDTNDYICVRRGCYKKKSTEEQAQEQEHNSLVEAYLDIFKETLRKSGNITSNPFQILNMNREDIAKLEDIEKCVRVISDTIEKIQ